MSNLDNALKELKLKRDRARSEVQKLNQLISGIESLSSTGIYRKAIPSARTVSAASRRKMALAQKARWAKLKAQTAAPKPKRHISAAGKKRIAAAARARWAKIRALKKAA